MQGRIKFWNSDKGYGFIRRDDGSDLFCHITAVHDTIEPQTGDACEYETEKGRNGKTQACSVYLKAVGGNDG